MKSYRILKKEAELKLKIKKKENVQDTKSKSLKININPLIISIMKTLRNKVQLIGNVGDTPKVLILLKSDFRIWIKTQLHIFDEVEILSAWADKKE